MLLPISITRRNTDSPAVDFAHHSLFISFWAMGLLRGTVPCASMKMNVEHLILKLELTSELHLAGRSLTAQNSVVMHALFLTVYYQSVALRTLASRSN